MIVDAHTHPVFLGGYIHPGLDQLSKAYYGRECIKWTRADFLAGLDRAGVDKAIVLTVSWKGHPIRERNEATAELVSQHPDRLVGFASFDPNTGAGAVEEVQYAVEQLGLSGVKIVAPNVEVSYNDPRYYPIYERIEQLGVPIVFHTGGSFLHTRSKFGDPLTLDDVAHDFPEMKVIVAHLAMERFLDAHSLLVRHANVYADLSFWPLHPIYRRLIPWSVLEETVADKLLYGSDFPVGQTPTEGIAAVKSLPVSDDFKAKVLGENTAKVLGLQAR